MESQPLKLLFITRKWPPAVGGMELYSEELTHSLSKHKGIELDIFRLPGTRHGHAPGLASIIFFILRCAYHLLRHSRNYDVVHFGDFVLFPLAVLDKVICKQHVRCMTIYGLDLTYGRKKGFLPFLYRKFVFIAAKFESTVDCYIAISRFTAQLAEDVGLENVVTIPLGIRLEKFTEKSQIDDASRCDEYPSVETPFIFYIGRVVERKGAIWFAKNVLPLFDDNMRFLVAGRIYSKRDRKVLESLPNVEILGQVSHEEALRLRKRAVAVVMPNIPHENSADVEGFGLTALEAPAAGGVLIAADLEGISDAVIDGTTGYLARPGDPHDWKEKICEILAWSRTEREQFVANAREALEKEYNWDKVAERTVTQYILAAKKKLDLVQQ